MAIDHIRDFFHSASIFQNPENLATTTPFLFFTRWITHFCAPTFALLAGLGIALWSSRHPQQNLSRYLLTRGLWLLFLELTLMRFAINLSLSWHYPFLLLVFFSLGASMLLMAALVKLPPRLLLALSLLTVFGHNLLDPINATQFGSFAWLWHLLHQPGPLPGTSIIVGYPFLAWTGVMGLGYSLAPVFSWEPHRRQTFLRNLGLASIAAFVLLRATNLYGDPLPWSWQPTPTLTLLSFLKCMKYPPSLCFLLMTLGPALLALSYFDRFLRNPQNPLLTYGRVPQFFFLAHFALLHFLSDFAAWLRYGNPAYFYTPLLSTGGPPELYPPGFGYDLWVTYAVWLLVLLLLYPLCRALGRLKAAGRSPLWSYL